MNMSLFWFSFFFTVSLSGVNVVFEFFFGQSKTHPPFIIETFEAELMWTIFCNKMMKNTSDHEINP